MKTLVSLILCLSVVNELQASNQLTFERQLTISSSAVESVEVITGPGKLVIMGVAGNDVVVDGTIRSKDYDELADLIDEFDNKMLFYIKQQPGVIQIMSKPRKSMFNTPNIQIDTTIRLPKDLNLMIDDGSGSIVIENISGRIEIDDQSGSLVLKNISNDVVIEDDSGSIRLNNIGGSVDIEDKAGSIKLSDIGGDVRIIDRSGSIEAFTISGNLSLDDGSGDVTVHNLGGQFKVVDKGSGNMIINGKSWPEQ